MRYFIAVELPKEVKSYLYEIEKKIGSSDAKIKWVTKKNFHLTLKFLGNIEQERIEIIKKRLSSIKFNSIKAQLGKIGVFPNENKINTIWVSLEPGKEIKQLAMLIDSESMEVPMDHEFKSHLTLGRVKLVKFKEDLLEKLHEIEVEPLEFTIKEFKLMKSTLTKDGSKYEIVQSY